MTWQPTAALWRPCRFDQVVGQPATVRVLQRALVTGRVPVSILLSGPAGTGKTTIARLLAAALNCRGVEEGHRHASEPPPCGSCSMCRDVQAGRAPFVEEVDAGSERGIEDVERIRQIAQLATPTGTTRVFVIDECQQITARAWTALLKLVEEPPPATVFVFATTNPAAVIETIVSRSMRFTLGRVPDAALERHVREVAGTIEAGSIRLTDQEVACIVREADGSVRDALHLLDAALLLGDSRAFIATFGTPAEAVETLANAILDENARSFLVALDKVEAMGLQPSEVARVIMALARDFWMVASGWTGRMMSGLPAAGIAMNLNDSTGLVDRLFRAAAQLVERRSIDRIDVEVAYIKFLRGYR